MYGRVGLERFKKAESLEPFSVSSDSSRKPSSPVKTEEPSSVPARLQPSGAPREEEPGQPATQVTQCGAGQSSWVPPEWAVEPISGMYYLEVMKDGEILGRINLEKRRHIFGRQVPLCDFVLDHQSISRQHAAVVPHKNGSIYVIDMGSAHGTFVANERVAKDIPAELELGQSVRFAASTRSYVLRKNILQRPPSFTPADLPPPPDPNDRDALVAYNTMVNRRGVRSEERESKRPKRKDGRVSFRDEAGGELWEVVRISDGADVSADPGPVGVSEGSLVGKYESLVRVRVVPRRAVSGAPGSGDGAPGSGEGAPTSGVTERLREVMEKVRRGGRGGGIYDGLYGREGVSTAWAGFSEEVVWPDGADGCSEIREAAAGDDDDLFGE